MVSTYMSYRLIVRDIDRSLQQVEKQPIVERESKYFLENIAKVKSIDEFVDDTRLFKYAMKAFGLSDMDYAKAFMKKVLEGGVKEPDSFANRLSDKKYAEFARTFDFVAHGEKATVYSQVKDGTIQRYQLEAALAGVSFDHPLMKAQVEYYAAHIGEVKSIDDFLADDALFSFAMKAYGLADKLDDKAFMRKVLEGGVADPDSFANRQSDPKYAEFAAVFDFAARGEEATTYIPAQHGVVDKYMRQTLEENAGTQNEGVRLALYFQRKAQSITTPYQILADKALGTVVRTALGLPDAIAKADLDKQAALLKERLDFADFKDPQKLDKFLARFTTMWELNNGTPAAASPAVLLAQPVEFGISTDTLLALQQLRR